jgi:hypothetical protein
MTYEHRVANWWYDGTVTWEHPKDIVRRPRGATERMVYLETQTRSLRVTEGHKMLHRGTQRQPWAKRAARDLVGKSAQIPVCGMSGPQAFATDEPEWVEERAMRRRVSASAYQIRNREGYAWEDSFAEAERRICHRLGLRHKAPHELSTAECWLIGFWIGDGSVCAKPRGGHEYLLAQSTVYPAIVERVDRCLAEVGVHVSRRERPARENASAAITWSMPRGTGSGSQQRVGVYGIERYLDKDGSELLWGLDAERFDALIEGLWFADGAHGAGLTVPDTLHIHGANERLLSHLQAIASVRGYRAHQRSPVRPRCKRRTGSSRKKTSV